MSYCAVFERTHGHRPHPYQERVAAELAAGRNVALRAPTGSGKTKAVLTPFLFGEWPGRPSRLIYALPLRSLVEQIRDEAAELLVKAGFGADDVTVQTGEQPDDELFDRGRVIVTTYDQVLSGLLCAPYGLSSRLANVNAAAVVNALVVFDEFHLMGLNTALLTGAAALDLFAGLSQSVWMTATATAAPRTLLGEALGCAQITLDADEMAALPAVAQTTRQLVAADAPLTAEAVIADAGEGRTIVIANTVERAMVLFRDLKRWAEAQSRPVPCFLLHARFFKRDRDERTRQLARHFGEGTREPAILVATQVVEAGVNISCQHLFTELCPMSSLLQRAGRCARFIGERGVVHVCPLPDAERAWLPYGTLGEPAPALAATAAVLAEQPIWTMSPALAEEWVERVHGAADALTIEGALPRRANEIADIIHCHATRLASERVAPYIRDEAVATIRVLIADEAWRPSRPAERESIAIARYRIARLIDEVDGPIGWRWDLSGDEPVWCPIENAGDVRDAYVVCLHPRAARYDIEEGVWLGEPGLAMSPTRTPPRPRRARPLRRETWLAHTGAVVAEARRRWDEEGGPASRAAVGLGRRLDLSPEALAQAVEVCALLHDAGKLRGPWQRWAEAYERDRDPAWRHVPLAHTAFDRTDPADRARDERIRRQHQRGTHAAASAWYGLPLIGTLLDRAPNDEDHRVALASAGLAAIVAHHGGWLPEPADEFADRPVPAWPDILRELIATPFDSASAHALAGQRDRRGQLQRILDRTTSRDRISRYWALVAYLTRRLRLADQRATAEGGSDD